MTDAQRNTIIEKVEKYGALMSQNRKHSAKRVLEGIRSDIKTDREEFMDWLDRE